MAGVNKVILLGNLGTDPEVRVLSTGTKTARLSIATSETYTNKNGEKVTNTEWHTVNVWRGQADVAEKYLSKGRQVYIEGKLRKRSYEDKDGNTKYVTEIEADTMTLVGSGNRDSDYNYDYGNRAPQSASTSEPAKKSESTPEPEESEDVLPF